MRPYCAAGSGARARPWVLACLILLMTSPAWADSTAAGAAGAGAAAPPPTPVSESAAVIAAANLATADVVADLLAAAGGAIARSACGPGAIPGSLPTKPLPYGVDDTFIIDIANSTEPLNPFFPLPSPAPEVEKAADASALAFGGGSLQIPYTTRSAGAADNQPGPTANYPWAPTGLLSVKYENRNRPVTCTASLIAPGLAVTAAQCLFNYGGAPFADGAPAAEPSAVQFAPGLYGTAVGTVDPKDQPYGVWVARTLPDGSLAVFLPPAWVNGTDAGAGAAPAPLPCANDFALVALAADPFGVLPGEYAGFYGLGWDGYATSESFYPGGGRVWQLNTLSYPPNFDAKTRPVTTTGPAIQFPGDVAIVRGTGVLRNDAGGPWLAGFSAADPDGGLPPGGPTPNVVVAVSSDGPVVGGPAKNSGGRKPATLSEGIKLQAGTPFATNAAYPDLPNVVALVQAACDSLPPGDRAKVCGDRASIAAACRAGGASAAGASAPAVPQTTAGAYSYEYSEAPDTPTVQGYVATATAAAPWNAAGKLTILAADGARLERSAALIGPGLVLTAAEAVVIYGGGPTAASLLFEPARFDGSLPLGAWAGASLAVSRAWAEGTAACDAEYATRLRVRACDANYALIALLPDGEGRLPGSAATGGSFFALPPTTASNYSFTAHFFPDDSNATGALAAQVTVLGYPSGGARMARTDGVATSLRLAGGGGGGEAPGRYEMGSELGEGGIGGAWVVNFGAPFADDKYNGAVVPPGADAAGNVVVGVTGWWDGGIQGASALGPDFFDLVSEFCGGLGAQRAAVCGQL